MNGGLLLLSAPALRLHVRIIVFVSNLLTEANPRHSVDGSCVCCLSVFFFLHLCSCYVHVFVSASLPIADLLALI